MVPLRHDFSAKGVIMMIKTNNGRENDDKKNGSDNDDQNKKKARTELKISNQSEQLDLRKHL